MLSKEKIDKYLEILGREIFINFGPSANIPMVIVGGAAIAVNYTFRESTMDIDTYMNNSAALESLISKIAKEHNLEDDWLNSNVMVTQSFTENIGKYAEPYKTFSGVLHVKVADSLTLICMKSVCCRPDSHDLLDIASILDEDSSITYDGICERFVDLYGDWSKMSVDAQIYLQGRFQCYVTPDMFDLLPPSMLAKAETFAEKMELCRRFC